MRWGLDSGADVSANGVCSRIPLDAALVDRSSPGSTQVRVPSDIFKRLLHPTNVNRQLQPIAPNDLPIHRVISTYNYDLVIHLLNAGARLDAKNHLYKLPMESYLDSLAPWFRTDPAFFRQLVPRELGISPPLFLEFVFRWKFGWPEHREFYRTIFSEHLIVSSIWRLRDVDESAFCEEAKTRTTPKMCVCATIHLIEIFMKCCIQAKDMLGPLIPRIRECHSAPCHNRYKEMREKWREYRTFAPSLYEQSVRAVRSSLGAVTKDKVSQLRLPTLIQKDITLEPLMEELAMIKFPLPFHH